MVSDMGYLQEKYTRAYYLHETDMGQRTAFGVAGLEEFRAGTIRRHSAEILAGIRFEGLRVLDFGFGRGEALKLAHDCGARQICGVDFSPAACDIAAGHLARHGIQADLVCADALSFAHGLRDRIKGAVFDVIMMLDFVEHVPRRELVELLPIVRSMLSARGVLIINTPVFDVDNDVLAEGLKQRARDTSDDCEETNGMHCNRYTRASLLSFMRNQGLVALSSHYFVRDLPLPRILHGTPWAMLAAFRRGYPIERLAISRLEPVEVATPSRKPWAVAARQMEKAWSRGHARAAGLTVRLAARLAPPSPTQLRLEPLVVEAGPLKEGRLLLCWNEQIPWHREIRAGVYDHWLFECVASMDGIEGAVVWDVGGHIGYDTLAFARLVGSNGHVCAFEPNPANLDRLQQNLELNADVQSRVRVLDQALGCSDERVPFRFTDVVDNGASSRSHLATADPPENRSVYAKFLTRDVEVARGDRLVSEGTAPPPRLVKIDVEGAEAAVLDGLSNVLTVHRPSLAIEVHTVRAMFRVQQQLDHHDYSVRIVETPDDAPSRCFLWATPNVR